MPKHSIHLTDSPQSGDIESISRSLNEFNIQKTGIDDVRPIAVLIKDPETGKVIGGLTGRTSLGLLFVDLFYIPPSLRGEGLGSRILAEAEAEAIERGCRGAVLYTINFQAPEFYLRHGWRVFGDVPCEPAGSSRVFMRKDLV
ncbi:MULTISPECIES: GNAT family N-acetyltransferase [Paraburkholderia]|uniref:GNAT superfamily N-acetyltransferase n=2 Tax=Paraburkholderia TaxID=1822464 RepID=A0A7Y9W6J5_9BURK|nr:GNAT family N-acetyltransferase [Paraburkholderia bryophila]NYH14760.1 GNAT superfamily N-acetyltransferase [Paraburkholderia bryophila]NYH26923.1 GNAT superfamily N-acetyltransferase [Paraburkholderia bryophila]